jgi:hypothetical protein
MLCIKFFLEVLFMIISHSTGQLIANNGNEVKFKRNTSSESKDMVTLGGTNSKPDFMALKDLSSQTAGISELNPKAVIKGVCSAVAGVLGGAMGLVVGTIYDATLVLPLNAAFCECDGPMEHPEQCKNDGRPYGARLGSEFVNQMEAPVRWAIDGANFGADFVRGGLDKLMS